MSNQYSPDSPIDNESCDIFQRNLTAKAIAKALKSFDKKESYVIGLYGVWGYGKTSTINLVKKIFIPEDKYEFIYIDAWEHAKNIPGIQLDIFNKIFANKEISKREKKKLLLERIKPKKTPNIEVSTYGIKISSDSLAGAMASMNERRKIKDVIEHAVTTGRVKYIICIDNIDRLSGDDVVDLLEQINRFSTIGGFTYILPFDKAYVCKTISGCLPAKLNGEDYLDKMIHIPIALPTILQEDLDKMFDDKLTKLLSDLKIQITNDEQYRFATMYSYYGLNKYFATPRDVVRSINALRFSLSNIREGINLVDLIVLELIKLFEKSLYDKIYINKWLFIKPNLTDGVNARFFNMDDESKKKLLHSMHSDDSIGWQSLLELFPYARSNASSSTVSPSEDMDRLRRAKRVACPDYFDVYFSPSISPHDISDSAISALLAYSCDKKQLNEKIYAITNSNYSAAFRKIITRKDEIKNKLVFCESLLDLAESYGYGHSQAFALSLSEQVLFTIDNILCDEKDKLAIYESMLDYNFKLNRSTSIPFLMRQAIVYSQPNRAQTKPTLSQKELEEYKEFALGIIRMMAEKNLIPWNTTGQESFIYSYWSELGSKKEIDTYVRKHVKTADNAVDFISQFLGSWSGSGENYQYRGDFDSTTLKAIGKYVDTSYLYELISADTKYVKLANSELKDLKSFENPIDNRYRQIGATGKEHTDEFRKIVAERFMYFYNKKKTGLGNGIDKD